MEPRPANKVFKKVPVAEVPAILRSLLAAFREKEFSHAQIIEAFASDLTATCSDCRLIFSGRELSQIATEEKLGSFQKLARLNRGECGRRDCPSPTYELAWPEGSTFPWDACWERATTASTEAAEKEAAVQTPFSLLEEAARKRKLILAVVLALLAILAIYWRVRTPSWSSRPSTYRVEPERGYEVNP